MDDATKDKLMKSVVNENGTLRDHAQKSSPGRVKRAAADTKPAAEKGQRRLAISWEVSPAQPVEIIDLTGKLENCDLRPLASRGTAGAPEIPAVCCTSCGATLAKI
jgi:hypothetical protein